MMVQQKSTVSGAIAGTFLTAVFYWLDKYVFEESLAFQIGGENEPFVWIFLWIVCSGSLINAFQKHYEQSEK